MVLISWFYTATDYRYKTLLQVSTAVNPNIFTSIRLLETIPKAASIIHTFQLLHIHIQLTTIQLKKTKKKNVKNRIVSSVVGFPFIYKIIITSPTLSLSLFSFFSPFSSP
jgi:hypothetical protein